MRVLHAPYFTCAVLQKVRRRLYGRTKPGTLLKHHVPLRTDRWTVTTPGFTEVDLVAHSGRVRRHDDAPQTPLDRVRPCPEADRAKVAALVALRQRLDPFALAARIERDRLTDLRVAPKQPAANPTGGVRFSWDFRGPRREFRVE